MVDEIGAGTDGSDFKFGSLKTYARLLEGISFSRFDHLFRSGLESTSFHRSKFDYTASKMVVDK